MDASFAFSRIYILQVEVVEHLVEDAGQHNVTLRGLTICLGPDLRAVYPLVMNFGVAGELEVSGPAHPDQVGGSVPAIWAVDGGGGGGGGAIILRPEEGFASRSFFYYYIE